MRIILLLFTVLGFRLFTSCSGIEACSDPLARNYDAEADVNCCCQYYQLRFDISQVSDSSGTPLVVLNAYPDAAGDFYQLKSSAILISSVVLIDAAGQEKRIDNQIEIPLKNGNSAFEKNDFSILKPGVFIENIGDFTSFGNFVTLRFLIGLNDVSKFADATKITASDNPLSENNSTGLYDPLSTDYNYGKWEIIQSNSTDTVVYNLKDSVWIQLPVNITAKDGVDTDIAIRLNYAKIFETVSFQNDDSLTIIQKIKSNLAHAFSVP